MMAATQAPIIMMSQNRASSIDRIQNDFISRVILRNEQQTRHIDAKVEHLLNYQWKRLLEIQEIQTQLLQNQSAFKKKATERNFDIDESARIWSVETCFDPLTQMLLRHYFEKDTDDDGFIFSHWHQDGDNFTGDVDSVTLDFNDENHLIGINFVISFAGHPATLDDMFSGQNVVQFRNDFNLPFMQPLGRFNKFRISIGGKYMEIVNGEFPPRYKPVFSRSRTDRITELWKTPIHEIHLSYTPPPQLAHVHVQPGQILNSVTVTLNCTDQGKPHNWIIYSSEREWEPMELLKSLISTPEEKSEHWTMAVDHEPEVEEGMQHTRSIPLSIGLLDEGHHYFLCQDGRVGFNGHFESA